MKLKKLIEDEKLGNRDLITLSLIQEIQDWVTDRIWYIITGAICYFAGTVMGMWIRGM